MKDKQLTKLEHQHKYKSETVWRMTLVMLITGATAVFLALSIFTLYTRPAKTYKFEAKFIGDEWQLTSFSKTDLKKPLMSKGQVLQWTTDQLLREFKLSKTDSWSCVGNEPNRGPLSTPSDAQKKQDEENSLAAMKKETKYSDVLTPGAMIKLNRFIRTKPSGETYQNFICNESKKGVLSSSIKGSPSVQQQAQGPNGAYYWIIKLPLQITKYSVGVSAGSGSVAQTLKNIDPSTYTVRLLVVREKQTKYPYGIAIERMVLTPTA
jgi:hypothetical protein